MKYRVLIPTSGIGSRLGDITKFTNKALVRIENKPSISYIIEKYPEDCEFVITLGYFGSHVKQFLKIAYPTRKFIFVNVDNYQGTGSSLGYSMLKAREHLQMPFIYNACDTISQDTPFEPAFNYVCGFRTNDLSQYDSYNIDEFGYLTKTFEKGEIGSDFAYIGLIGVNDFKKFWEMLAKLNNSAPENTKLSDFWCVHDLIKKQEKWKHIEVTSWYDIGNAQSLQNARDKFSKGFTVLDKSNESIFILKDSVIKFFSDPISVKNRVIRAEQLSLAAPKIISSTENFFKYEFIPGDLMADVVSEKNVIDLLEWSKKNLWQKASYSGNFYNLCYNFYRVKTVNRINEFLESKQDQKECINGVEVLSIEELLNKIDFNKLCSSEPSKFHGDFILDNILKTNDTFKLIDWRQDFAGNIEVGDMYYDLAKLNHSFVVNHKTISKNLFILEKHHDKIYVDIFRKQSFIDSHSAYFKWIESNNYDLKKIKILTALIWLNMAPLHHKPFNEFLYYYGKYNLHKYIINND